MKLGLDARGGVTNELLDFGVQLGATDVIGGILPEESGYWEYLEYLDLLRIRSQVEAVGMRLFAIENLPQHWMDKIKLGLPGRDEQLDKIGMEVIPVELRDAYAFGGGLHCCTADVYREGTIKDYFPKQ